MGVLVKSVEVAETDFASSKIPLQEFKTGCYITQEPTPTQALDHGSLPADYGGGMPRYLPTVRVLGANTAFFLVFQALRMSCRLAIDQKWGY